MKNFIIIAILILVTGLSFVMLKNLEDDLSHSEKNTAVREVAKGYHVQTRHFDTNNQLSYNISSDMVTDYSGDGGTRFTKPRVEKFRSSNVSWTMTAERGFLSANKDDLTVFENVHFLDVSDTTKPLSMKGSVMYYNRPTSLVSSDEPTIINNGVLHQTSNYFSLNTITNVITFDKAIQGRYAAPQKVPDN